MIVLGIDPGYAIVGYGVVEMKNNRYRTLEHGAVTTKAGTDFNRRLEIIYDGIAQVLAQYHPDAISVEKLYFSNNKTTGIGVAEARGVILLAAQKARVPVFEYTPVQVKLAVTGYGKALKPQVMEMTRRLCTGGRYSFRCPVSPRSIRRTRSPLPFATAMPPARRCGSF